MSQNYPRVFLKMPESAALKKIAYMMRSRNITLRIGKSVIRKKGLIFTGPVFQGYILKFSFTCGMIQSVKPDKMFLTHKADIFCERTKKHQLIVAILQQP